MNSDIIIKIKELASSLLPDIIEIRRHLHANPELSFKEEKTSNFIADILTKANIPFTQGWAGHGIVATIKGKSNKVVALRGDMDALPIIEANEVEYKSKSHGIMHACGHDVHTSSLLGAALILNQLNEDLPHSVLLIFQPGEEQLPGGASLMIAEGVLKNPEPIAMIGQHVFPSLETGKVGVRSGLYMASADEVYITVKGIGGHGAMPHEVKDPVLATSQMIVSLQQIVSRNANPAVPTVLSFGKMNTIGGATNIIPNEVKLEGTFRTMDEAWRMKAHALIKNIAENCCMSYGCSAEVEIIVGYPCLINDVSLSKNVKILMQQYLGVENVIDLDLRMTSEDFAFYSQIVPSCFYRLGTRNESKGITSPVHTTTFDVDEDSMEIGMGLMAWLAFNQDESV